MKGDTIMVKAKEFWHCLCEELDYRVYSGVPCIGLDSLYSKLDSRLLHYVPAANECVGLGLVNGAFLAGTKGGVLIHIDRLHNILDRLVSFNLEYNVPLLIIAYCDEDSDTKPKKVLSLYKIPCRNFSGELKNLKFIINKIEKLSIPGVIIMREGDIE